MGLARRLLGHWGTTPGLRFIYVHLNRLIHDGTPLRNDNGVIAKVRHSQIAQENSSIGMRVGALAAE